MCVLSVKGRLEGILGGDMVAGRKGVGYIWDLSVQAFHMCLFHL